MNDDNKNEKVKKGKENLNKFVRYSTLAFEMGIIIGIGSYGGHWLDNYFSFDKPILTVILSLFAVLASLYIVIKQLLNGNK